MKLPDSSWRTRAGLPELLAALDAKAGATRFVGGYVRDALLGLPAADIDLATRLLPDTVMARVRDAGFKAVPTGLAHGTVTAVLPSGPIEVTALRRDVATDGRHATVAFTDDWREDAARRDFTINALFADPDDGSVVDFFGGLEDIAVCRVRFIGDPAARIGEDHLRILRFFRFHARFGRGEPDAAGLAACTARANDLMALSRERIADELLKLLALADPAPTLGLMVANGILRPVLPEIDAVGVARVAALVRHEATAGVATHPIRRLAALLPADGAAGVCARLRLSKAATKRLVVASGPAQGGIDALAYRIGALGAGDRLLLAGSADAAGLARLAAWERPRLPLGGGDLMALGLAPGPVVAHTLAAVEQAWVDEGFPDADRTRDIARAAVTQARASRQ